MFVIGDVAMVGMSRRKVAISNVPSSSPISSTDLLSSTRSLLDTLQCVTSISSSHITSLFSTELHASDVTQIRDLLNMEQHDIIEICDNMNTCCQRWREEQGQQDMLTLMTQQEIQPRAVCTMLYSWIQAHDQVIQHIYKHHTTPPTPTTHNIPIHSNPFQPIPTPFAFDMLCISFCKNCIFVYTCYVRLLLQHLVVTFFSHPFLVDVPYGIPIFIML